MLTLKLSHDVKRSVLTSVVLTLLLSALCSVYFVFAQPLLPIFYSLALPQQQLVPKVWLFMIPSISVGITLIHTSILSALSGYDRTIQRLFVWVTVVLQVLLILSVVRIILITW